MATNTDNHGLILPIDGEDNWGEMVRTNTETLDTALEIRDTDANRSTYTPKAGAKYLTTDTGEVFVGLGTEWESLGTIGGGAASDTHINAQNPDGTLLAESIPALRQGTDIGFSVNADGSVSVAFTGTIPEDTDTHLDVENEDGVVLENDVTAMLAGTDLQFSTHGDGSVALDFVGSSGSDTRVNVENVDNTPLVTGPVAIHARTGLVFADDGDDTVSLDVDTGASLTWTATQAFDGGATINGNAVLTTADEGSLDAGTLDGVDSTSFLRNDQTGTVSGSLNVTGTLSEASNSVLTTADEGTLDAGTLDGLDSGSFVRSDQSGSVSGDFNVTGTLSEGGDGVLTTADQTVVASGTVTLTSGSEVVSTGVGAGNAIDVSLDPSGNGVDVKAAARAFWDSAASEMKVEIIEDGTNVSNPTIGYVVVVNA